jgi:CDP-paratose 2-epimerase
MIEAIRFIQELSGHRLNYTMTDQVRSGDHIWYISDVGKFQLHYPDWKYTYTIESMLREMIEAARYK